MDPAYHRGDDKAEMTDGKSTSSRRIQNPSNWGRVSFGTGACLALDSGDVVR